MSAPGMGPGWVRVWPGLGLVCPKGTNPIQPNLGDHARPNPTQSLAWAQRKFNPNPYPTQTQPGPKPHHKDPNLGQVAPARKEPI